MTLRSTDTPTTDPRFWETCAELRQVMHQLGAALGPKAKAALTRVAELHQRIEQDASQRQGR